jgi:hypothetical protein
MPATYHSPELRVQVLTLWALKIQSPDIGRWLDLPNQTVRNIIKKGKDRGYNPNQSPRVKLEFMDDGKRSGRPKVISEDIKQAVISLVTKD